MSNIETGALERRDFIKGALATGAIAAGGLFVTGCSSPQQDTAAEKPGQAASDSTASDAQDTADTSNTNDAATNQELPTPEPDPESDFGVDANINMKTIDSWLGRDDVAYRDVRMLFDPADFGSLGGNADLDKAIEGFRIVPYPYLATLGALPVAGAYTGETLYTLTWDETGAIATATPNYAESAQIIKDCFPKDKAIFIMCGAGGYAANAKDLLIYLGWDADKLYNVGGGWEYAGKNSLDLIDYGAGAGEADIFATWRADYAYIDFSRLNPA